MANKKSGQGWYSSMSDEGLIKSFYMIPILNVIFSVIVTGVFVSGFAVLDAAGEDDKAIWITLLLFAIGALLSAACRLYFSSEKRAEIAGIMSERYSDGSNSNVYYWFFKREKELNGSIRRSVALKIWGILSVIMTVVNYLFSLLSALLLIIFASVFLIVSGFGYVFYIIAGSGGSNVMAEIGLTLAKVGFVPLKLAFRFAKLVLKPNVRKDDFSSVINDLDNFSKSGEAPASKTVAELRVHKYISLDSFYLAHCTWKGGVTVRFNDVYVEGTLVCDPFVHKDNIDVSRSVSQAEKDISALLKGQIEKYYKDYPMAERVNVHINIDGIIG